jgi:hypothetical protein
MARRKLPLYPKLIIVAVGLLALAGLVLFPLNSYGKQARITDLLLAADAKSVNLYCVVTDCFTPAMDKAIMAGVPTMFTFVIDLCEDQPQWFGRRVQRLKVNHTLKYDNVKNVFYVYADERDSAGFPDLESAKRAMAELNGVPVAASAALSRQKTYYVRVKASLDKVRLPMHMEALLFFVSLWDFETDWMEKSLPAKIQ